MLDAKPLPLPIRIENHFLPDLGEVQNARLLFLNYPNNPTGATAPVDFMKRAAELAEDNQELTIAFDNAYSEMTFGEPSHSILEYSSQAVEFHSLSKMANATGYRVGFAVGEPNHINALVRIKEEMDSGAPLPFQRALAALLERYNGTTPPMELTIAKRIYAERKRKLADVIKKAGFQLFDSDATFYLWFRVGEDETEFTAHAIEAGVLVTPGSGFGGEGRGWIRLSATAPDDSIEQAGEILQRLG